MSGSISNMIISYEGISFHFSTYTFLHELTFDCTFMTPLNFEGDFKYFELWLKCFQTFNNENKVVFDDLDFPSLAQWGQNKSHLHFSKPLIFITQVTEIELKCNQIDENLDATF